ncbi:MAG: hypothetical protein JXA66_07995, partial [Oligoflexia bacterium]|nr:hypothetical protein [Oligoflexia bacterium]
MKYILKLRDMLNTQNRVVTFFLLAFAVLSISGINGFNLSIWHGVIDGSRQSEVFFGKTRPIRSDDWLVNLPLILSQTAGTPKFGKINNTTANRQNMLFSVTTGFPVRHYFSVFKPGIWGFFIGRDFGLSWLWWYQTIGMILSLFLVFMIFTNKNITLSLSGSLIFTYSPFVQLWSLNNSLLYIPVFLSVFFSHKILTSQSYKSSLAYSVLLVWSGINFVTCFYAPYQVALSYIFIALFAALMIRYYKLFLRSDSRNRIITGFVVSFVVSSLILFVYLNEIKDVISIMMNTSYPGRRFLLGGNQSMFAFFFNLLLPFPANPDYSKIGFGNICEASNFLYLFPVTILFFVFHYKDLKKDNNKYSIYFMLAVLALFLYYSFAGFPEILARVTLLSYVHVNRLHAALGVINIFLLIMMLRLITVNKIKLSKRFVISSSVLMFLILSFTAYKIIPAVSTKNVWSIFLLYGLWIISFYYLYKLKINRFLAGHAVITLLMTFWFNPLVFGSTDFIYTNELSKKIIQISSENPGKYWVTTDTYQISNLPRMLGVKSAGGLQFYPDFEFWKIPDP